MPKSIRKPAARKHNPAKWPAGRPQKPYPTFPLTPHVSGKWMKKIGGAIYYFGCWARVVNGVLTRVDDDGWEDALNLFKVQVEDIKNGRVTKTARRHHDQVTVGEVCSAFLNYLHDKHQAGEISPRMYKPGPPDKPHLATGEYKATTDRLVKVFGKDRVVSDLDNDDFARLRANLASQYGPVRLGNEVQKVRTIFKRATTNRWIAGVAGLDESFSKPSKDVMWRHRAQRGKRLFTAAELRAMIEAAGVPLKAMLLLGINAAFGNADCGTVTTDRLDLDRGWVAFPRPKNGIERRARLWPETVQALRDALDQRPATKNGTDPKLVFITKYGNPWSKEGTSGAVTHEMLKLLDQLGIDRPGLAFYGLRHTFRTIADEINDRPAIRLVMGHSDGSIDDTYREHIADKRLEDLARHVHQWLWPQEQPVQSQQGTPE